jgi:hypothetical protein
MKVAGVPGRLGLSLRDNEDHKRHQIFIMLDRYPRDIGLVGFWRPMILF